MFAAIDRLAPGVRVAEMPLQAGGEYVFGQVVIAFAVLAAIVVAALYLLVTTEYVGLDDRHREHKQAVARSRSGQRTRTLVLSAWSDTAAAQVRTALTDREHGADDPTPTEQLRTRYADLLAAVHDVAPPPVPRYVALGVVLPVLGYVATRTDWVVAAITTPPSGPTLVDYLRAGMTDVLAMTLGIATLWASWLPVDGVLTAARQVWDLLYAHPLPVGAALLVGGAGLLAVEYRGRPYPKPAAEAAGLASVRAVSVRLVVSLLGIWLLGVVPALVLQGLGLAGFGLLVGAGLAGLIGAATALRRLWTGLRRVVTIADAEHGPHLLAEAAYRRLAGAFAGVAALLVLAYLWVGIADGRLARVLAALPDAHPLKLALLLVGVGVPTAAAAFVLRADLARLAGWLATAVGSRSATALAAARGTRYVLVGVGAIFGARWLGGALGGGVLGATLGAAVGAGVAFGVVLGVQRLLARARLQLSVGERRRGVGTVYVRCYDVTDADGRTHYLVETVAGGRERRLASPDVEAVVEATADVVQGALAGDRADPSLPEWHAERLLDQGFADYDTNVERGRERVRKAITAPARENHGRADLHTVERTLRRERGPTELLWDHWLESEYFALDEHSDTIRMLADPWADGGARS